jgi:archaeal type IV pilus assembly protein PilA
MKTKKQSKTPHKRGILEKKRECAISPVVGVMLMLVVVVIIAAIVSAFAGGLAGDNSQKAPALTMDVKIIDSGNYRGSEFSMEVTGVSEPIPTRDLKIVTSWTTPVKINSTKAGCISTLPLGSVMHGGAEIKPGISNSMTQKTALSVAPYGFGPGVVNLSTSDMGNYAANGPIIPMYNWQFYSTTHFGNYSLEQGTVMMAEAGGRCINNPVTGGIPDNYNMGGYGVSTPYAYKSGNVYSLYSGTKTTPAEIVAAGGQADGMQAMLGCGWENLRAGDVVNMKVVHTPSGKTIFDKDIVVGSS